MTDTALMTAAVQANPADAVAQLVLADAIAEPTGDYAAARVEAVMIAQADAIDKALRAANGRRRVRTLDLSDVRHCVAQALRDAGGWWARGGATVANAYKYPAERTVCVAAVRTDGTVRIAIGVAGAKKGSSLTANLTGLAVNAKADKFRAWADAAK